MAPHLTLKDLDFVRKLQGKGLAPTEMYDKFKVYRAKKSLGAPTLANFRRVLKGKTYNRGPKETRGRRKKLSKAVIKKIFNKRKLLIQQSKGEEEITWTRVLRAARVQCDPTTAAKNLKAEGFDVQARKQRVKPLRPDNAIRERFQVCSRWRRYPASYWNEVDLIMDNKRWEVPTSAMAQRAAKIRKVRFVLRTRQEGLLPGFTKPCTRKHKRNPGASVTVVAGIARGRVRLWHYLHKGRWNGQAAADVYKGPISRCLRRNYPEKVSYKVLEDNDPSGYKSRKAREAKAASKIVAMQFPRYSPDLNPCDFFLWDEIERRMTANRPRGKESIVAFKGRLRKTAMAIPEAVIRKGVQNIKKRARAIFDAGGHDIACD